MINVLIACEESQVEMMAFRSRGFNAYSCDIQKPKRGGDLRYQILGDVRPYLEGKATFRTMDGKLHRLSQWHLIIAHPPCTYLCRSSGVQMFRSGQLNLERYEKMKAARTFFMECYNANAPFVAVENPVPLRIAELPQSTCFVEPFWYGHPYSKKTVYWLRNLPPLMANAMCPAYREFVRCSRGKYRSRTFEGVAIAMADQWGQYIKEQLPLINGTPRPSTNPHHHPAP